MDKIWENMFFTKSMEFGTFGKGWGPKFGQRLTNHKSVTSN